MKRLKGAVAIIFLLVVSYFLISYGIFWITKPFVDQRLAQFDQPLNAVAQTQNAVAQTQDVFAQTQDAVVIQNVEPVCTHGSCLHHDDEPVIGYDDEEEFQDGEQEPQVDVITNEEQEPMQPVHQVKEPSKDLHDSFITMNIPDDYQVDQDIQDTLDVLIGNDVDEFVKIILQSNNNIIVQQACRSCSMFAFFNGIKNHKPLSVEDVRLLQKMLANLYRFVAKMKALSNNLILREEQYAALQDLYISQAVKNDIKLKKRQAVTSAALKKLQMIQYNR